MIRSPVVVLLVLALAAAGCDAGGVDSSGSSETDDLLTELPAGYGLPLSLTFGDDEPIHGGAWVVERESLAAEDCAAASTLLTDAQTGIHLVGPTFIDRAPGTASHIIEGVPDASLYYWDPADSTPEAGETSTAWKGTLEIGAWDEGQVILLLIGGTLCSNGGAGSCEPSEDGVLVIDGLRGTHTPGASDRAPVFQDVATDQALCHVDWI